MTDEEFIEEYLDKPIPYKLKEELNTNLGAERSNNDRRFKQPTRPARADGTTPAL